LTDADTEFLNPKRRESLIHEDLLEAISIVKH